MIIEHWIVYSLLMRHRWQVLVQLVISSFGFEVDSIVNCCNIVVYHLHQACRITTEVEPLTRIRADVPDKVLEFLTCFWYEHVKDKVKSQPAFAFLHRVFVHLQLHHFEVI